MATVAIPADVFAAIEEWPCYFDRDTEADLDAGWPKGKPCPWCGGTAPDWAGCRTAIVAQPKEGD